MYIKTTFLPLIVLLSLLFWMSSCNMGRYMAADQSLLKNTKIVFKNKKSIVDSKKLSNELTSFITQSSNGKLLLFLPKEYIYLRHSGEDKNSFVNKALKNLGEEPKYFDSEEAKLIAKNMENYLRFKKGYYEAKVDYITEEDLRVSSTSFNTHHWTNTDVTYIVSTGPRYKIRDLNYISDDKPLINYIQSISGEAFVKEGDFIDFNAFELEKARLTLSIQNQGYSNFAINYIEIEGDSSIANKDIDIDFIIKSPLPDTLHKRYSVGKINVYTDYIRSQSKENLEKAEFDNITFYRQSQNFLVKPSLLNNSIFLKNGDVLNRENRQKSYRKLNNLGTYRFVTISSTPDEAFDTVMNFNVLLTPYQKKWIFDAGLQGYYSTLGGFDLLGLSLSGQATHRNLFGGSERFSTRLELGSEVSYPEVEGPDGTFRRSLVRRTASISLQNNLTIPSFVDFARMGSLLNRFGIIKDRFFNEFVEQANTNISIGFNINDISDFFLIQSVNASYGFDYTSPKGNRYIFKPMGINVDLYTIDDANRFNNNPLLLLSFQNILGTGFLFREFTHIYNKPKTSKGNSYLLFNTLEFSGLEVHLTNLLYNGISGRNDFWSLNTPTDLAFSKYIRYQFDGRYGHEISKRTNLASRLSLGVIVPFGENLANPFIKQFGVGGPNSLRAWNINQPGPGGYFDRATQDSVQIFVNQGDIRIELNAEYRFKMVWKLEGALFVDAGNVWMLRRDELRPQAHISRDFLSQLAIGAGYGLRFNFDFFIIRFDFGYKIRSPYVDEVRSRHWYTFKEIRQQGLGNVQVGVNYPF